MLLEFRKKYPKINLKVFVDNASMIEKMILANEIDFALTEGRVHSSHVVYEKFMDDELILLCAPKSSFFLKNRRCLFLIYWIKILFYGKRRHYPGIV